MEDCNKNVVLCPVCGSKNQKTLYPDTLGDDLPPFDYAFSPDHMRTYEVVRCQSCSHAFCIIPHKNLWENYQSVVDFRIPEPTGGTPADCRKSHRGIDKIH